MLKVHSRCDLACDHCYIYEHADQTWRDRPLFMSMATVRAASRRIAEHAAAHRLGRVSVVLHGGEPLLLGADRLRAVLSELRDTVAGVCDLDLRMQTNGVRLTEALCDLLREFGVKVGVSLDGDRAANDRHRRFRSGATSHPQTLRALALLRRPENRPIYSGILCTIDVANDPVEVYQALLAEEPPQVDLLLPHATWAKPPAHGEHGAWLRAVHARWSADGRPVPIRLFDSINSLGHGGPSRTEAVGPDTGEVVVIETDGAWEQPDSMKTTRHGAGATGLTVFAHTADQVTDHPSIRRRRAGLAGLSATCRSCTVVRQCGGGMVAHRYDPVTGFDNPSAYCADLKELITAMNEQPYHPGPGDLEAIPAGAFDQIGHGFGDAAAVAVLAEAQLSINRVLVSAVADKFGGLPDAKIAAYGWDLLAGFEAVAPAAAGAVLSHPFVRPWAVTCLAGGGAGPPEWTRIAAIAAAVAVRAGIAADIPVRSRAGVLHLPTLGTCIVPAGAGEDLTVSSGPDGFVVRWAGGAISVPADFAEVPGWEPARSIEVGGLRILLEDGDPYRDCHEFPATGRLTDAEAGEWTAAVAAAWPELSADAPEQVAGLRAGLRVLTPLTPAGAFRSATARHAFGAVGVAHTADAAALAVMLVHEFQHTKLGALLDLTDLVPATATERVTVGWRPDKRPIEGVLQGTYAHLGVADVWRRRAERAPDDREAARTFRMYRDWTEAAIVELRTGDRLTATGARFVDRMSETAGGWPA